MNVILTGFMGTGKSVTGRGLSDHLRWPFIDIDELIVERAGKPIPRIFLEQGEQAFRRIEKECLFEALVCDKRVISTGGGAIIDPEVRRHMKARGLVICFTASPEKILQRVGGNLEDRPMLSGYADPLTRIRELLQGREEAYARADLVINTDNLNATEQVAESLRLLRPLLDIPELQ